MEELDKSVLEWIAEHATDSALVEQLRLAHVKKRDYMRTGFFIYLDVPPEALLVDASVRPQSPDILSPELRDGAGSTLFLRSGRLHYLEIYARGGFFPEQLQNWQLADGS
jgi:hypothetical protein